MSVIVAEVAPLFHQEYVPPPDAVRVAKLPKQILLFPDMDAVGKEFTVTGVDVVLVQLPLETVTVYVVFEVVESVMVAEVAPLFHQEYVPPPLAVSVAISPTQIVVEPLISAVGVVFTVTVDVVVFVHPLASVTVTV